MHTLEIARSFNKACNSYDNSCSVQDMVCEELIRHVQLIDQHFNHVVDIGCGTGNSTLQLIHHLTCHEVFAVDIAEKLLAEARQKLSRHRVTLLTADFSQLLFQANFIDLMFSSMALHWSPSLRKSIEALHAQLAPNGLLAFAIPIGETFNELHELHRHEFHSQHEVRQILAQCNLTLITSSNKTYIAIFDEQKEALRSIKRIGANFIPNSKPLEGLHRREFFKCKDSTSLTYHIGFFIARKS